MNSGFWLPIVWRMPSETATLERFSSSVAERDAVDVEHDVGALGVLPEHRDLLGDDEVVGLGVRPVDQPDRLGLLADARLDLHAVAQQVVDVPVGLVQVVAAAERRSLLELLEWPC